MPRARTTPQYQETAAAPYQEGSGCFSGFALIPILVVLISLSLASLAWQLPHSAPAPLPDALSPIFRREVLHWADEIVEWANASHLDPNLVATIMQIESCGDPRAVSSAGAMGLFQVMPYHFDKHDNPFNPNTNAARGLTYLARALQTANGDARLAMAGYNGGIGIISRAEWTWSSQTKRYVQYGVPIYTDAMQGATESNAVLEWYSNYGVSLCQQASQRLGLP